jgi:hypothetical protein
MAIPAACDTSVFDLTAAAKTRMIFLDYFRAGTGAHLASCSR